MQLGAEHDQQKGDVYADDVIINSGSGTPGPVPGTLPGPAVVAAAALSRPRPRPRSSASAAANPDLGTVNLADNLRAARRRLLPGLPGRGDHLVRRPRARTRTSGEHPRGLGPDRVPRPESLGYPTGDVVCGQPGGGCYQDYQGGAIIWSAATGAHPTSGDVRAAWARTGFLTGFLRYPTADVICGQPGGGCYQDYQGGAIIWSAATGAHPTSGDVRAAWARTGFLTGVLRLSRPAMSSAGSPAAAATRTTRAGRSSGPAATGAHPTGGAIRASLGVHRFPKWPSRATRPPTSTPPAAARRPELPGRTHLLVTGHRHPHYVMHMSEE